MSEDQSQSLQLNKNTMALIAAFLVTGVTGGTALTSQMSSPDQKLMIYRLEQLESKVDFLNNKFEDCCNKKAYQE